MATNPYINNYNVSSEQNLHDSLIIEAIQFKGVDCRYIPRHQINIDAVLMEDKNNTFKGGKLIEMWPANVEGFDGLELFDMAQLNMSKSATFVVSKTRFREEFPDIGNPRDGDLIYMPVTHSFLEIQKVEQESPFFENGKQYCYELNAQLFRSSHEDIETGDAELDNVAADVFDPTKGFEHVEPEDQEDSSQYGQNTKVDKDTNQDYSFDPQNPWGI